MLQGVNITGLHGILVYVVGKINKGESRLDSFTLSSSITFEDRSISIIARPATPVTLSAASNNHLFVAGESANLTIVGVQLANAPGLDAVYIIDCGVFVFIP